MKLKIRKTDTVRVISGKDRGKTGKVIRVAPQTGRVVVEGVNLVARHIRSRRAGEKGQKIYFPKSLPVGRVKLVCGSCGKPTRVGYRIIDEQKKERICKKCMQPVSA